MNNGPVIVGEGDRDWETWPDGQTESGGDVHWKTLLSADLTDSSAMTLGVLQVPVCGALKEHRHAQPEIYFFLRGEGTVSVGGASRRVEKGDAIFIPGNASHSCTNTGEVELKFVYVFPVDSFSEIEYLFDQFG